MIPYLTTKHIFDPRAIISAQETAINMVNFAASNIHQYPNDKNQFVVFCIVAVGGAFFLKVYTNQTNAPKMPTPKK
jgi:hypothetical protein